MPHDLRTGIDSLVSDFSRRYDENGTLEWTRRIWQSDIESDYTAFHRTAGYVAEELRRAGATQVEVVPCPADGRTRMQAWTMPLAWEGGEAVLKIVSPTPEVLCDRRRNPFTCPMWSEPTPPGGVRGPLVVVDDLAKVTAAQRKQLRGAMLLTKLAGRGAMKVFAAEVGAAAVVSDFVPHVERHPDAIGWSNAWADDPGAWALKASDCRMTGFQVSPPTGRRLRELAARGVVTCEALVTGRVGPGVLPVVTGVVPGESQEEVLLLGHLYEIGVVDNASGCAAMMEAVRLMAAMPRPARTVRILLTSECYGTYAFFTQRPEILRRTLAGANLDCVAGEETTDRPRHWAGTNECLPSASDVLFREALRATEDFPKVQPAKRDPFGMSDNVIGDPAAGAPCVCLMGAPWHWHTNRDDWSSLSPEALRRATVVAASWARWLAEAGPAEADALAEAAAECTRKTYGEDSALPADRRAFYLDRGRERILSTRRLGATRAEGLAAEFPPMELSDFLRPEDGGLEEESIVPARDFWGVPTFDEIPLSQREGLDDPRWNPPYVSAAWWADGRRTVREIAALVRLEHQKPIEDLLKFFRVLQRGGLVTLRRP